MAKLITAGCGISQLGFDKWPTWPRYCILSHDCEHINVGGPASGNEHIARSVIRSIYEKSPACIIIVWTSYNKLDVYVETFSKYLQIKNFPTRNFLIDYQGHTVEAPGWWPSSVSDDNLYKKLYKETLESNTYYYIRTLESVLSVQNICKLKNIPCYMFLGYDWDFKFVSESIETRYLYSAIDWNMFRHMESLENNYINSAWFEYNTTKKNGMIPVAGWQYEFYVKEIMPILDQHFTQRELTKFWTLEKTALEITQDRCERKIS